MGALFIFGSRRRDGLWYRTQRHVRRAALIDIKKFLLYLVATAQGIHRVHFGIPDFFVPFITTNEIRFNSMMNVLQRITDGAGSRTIPFKTFPAFTSFEKPRPPLGHLLTEDGQRVGYPPFNFVSSRLVRLEIRMSNTPSGVDIGAALRDVAVLRAELDGNEIFARGQLTRLDRG